MKKEGEPKLFGGVVRLEGAFNENERACGGSRFGKAGLYDPERNRKKA
jgi:hypothetical protein